MKVHAYWEWTIHACCDEWSLGGNQSTDKHRMVPPFLFKYDLYHILSLFYKYSCIELLIYIIEMKTRKTFFYIMLVVMTLLSSHLMAQSKYVVTGQNVNVRKSASVKSAIVGSLSRGDIVLVKKIEKGWALIIYKNKDCYVNASFLIPKQEKENKLKNEPENVVSSPSRQTMQQQLPIGSQTTERGDSYNKYDKLPGFAMSTDMMLGYSNKTVTVQLGYDFGYQFNRMFYLGIGPEISAGFSDAGSTFSGGGYSKFRFTAPVNGSIKPMLDARFGYSYDFKNKRGNPYAAFGLGLNINRRLNAGIYVLATWSSEVQKKVEGSYLGKNLKVIEEKKTTWNFTPALFFSYEIGEGGTSSNTNTMRSPHKKHDGFKRFMKSTYFEAEIGYGLGLFKDDTIEGAPSNAGNNFLINVLWEKDFSNALTFGLGVGYRLISTIIKDEGADKFVTPFIRGKYKFLDSGSKFRPFAALDLGFENVLNSDIANGGVTIYPQVGVEIGKFSITTGYHRASWSDSGTKAGIGTIDLKGGIRF